MEVKYIHLYLLDFLLWILHLLTVLAHRLAKFFLWLLEFCYLGLRGSELRLSDDHLEVSSILFRNLDPFIVPFQTNFRFSKKYFATWHQCYEPIDYLNNPCISLCYVDENFVYFLEIEPHLRDELYNTRKHPFFELAIWKLCHKLIKVKKNALIKYTERVELPKGKIVYCTHSARCGSTALVQAMNSLKGWTAISEISWQCDLLPTSLSSYDEVKKYATSKEFRLLVAACIKAQLAPFPSGTNIFWKTHNYNEAWLVPIVKEFYPSIKIIYMTRSGSNSTDSYMKAYPISPWFDLSLFCYNRIPNLLLNWSTNVKTCRYALNHGLLTPELHEFMTDGRLTLYEMLWLHVVCGVALFKELCGDVPLLLVDYESYIGNLEGGLTKVLSYLDIPLSNLQAALDAYKVPSQTGSIYSGHPRSKIYGIYGRDSITEAKCDAFTKMIGIQGFQESPTRKMFASDKWAYLTTDEQPTRVFSIFV